MNNSHTSEEIPSPELERTPPKLNLPPKPVLASTAVPTPPTPSAQGEATPPTLPTFPLLTSMPEETAVEEKTKKTPKKKFSIGLPLALLLMLIALAAFLLQFRLLFF